jgi:hypothetical protein
MGQRRKGKAKEVGKYNRPAMPVSRSAMFVTILLLLAGIVRIGWIVGDAPIHGYANQFDTGRTSACIGLWPDLPEPQRYEPHREAPVAKYVPGPRRPAECYASSEVLFAAASTLAWRAAALAGIADPSAMDARFVGGVKAFALVLLAIVLSIALREHTFWLVAHAALFAIVLADPFVTLWLNTLYTEFTATLFAYAAVGCLLVLCCIRPDRTKWYVLLSLALLGLGLSRQQHAYLPLFLAALMLPVGWRYRRGWSAVVVLVALAVAVAQAFIPRPATIRAANNVNSILGTLLPLARDQTRALAILQLPERCAGAIGSTWYVTMGEDLAERCPEAAKLPRSHVVDLLLDEPSLAVRAIAKAAPLARTMLLRYVGTRAGESFATLENEPFPLARSIAPYVERLPLYAHIGWYIFLFALLPLTMAVWLIASARGGGSAGALTASALAGIFCYALATSVLGDGLVEVARHAHMGTVAGMALLVLLVVTLVGGVFARHDVRYVAGAPVGQAMSLEVKLGIAALAIMVAMTGMLWVPWYRKLPLAIGTLDEPASNLLAAPRTTLRGWALDPLGTVRVYATLNEGAPIEARPFRLPADPDGARLARVFPYSRDPASARFEIPLDLSAAGGKPVRVRTYAIAANDTVTEIDRRVLQIRAR